MEIQITCGRRSTTTASVFRNGPSSPASPQTEINPSWASGFGVRLLDRLVADKYEG